MITVITHYTVNEPITRESRKVMGCMGEALAISPAEARELAELSDCNVLGEGPNTSTVPDDGLGALRGLVIAIGAEIVIAAGLVFMWGAQ